MPKNQKKIAIEQRPAKMRSLLSPVINFLKRKKINTQPVRKSSASIKKKKTSKRGEDSSHQGGQKQVLLLPLGKQRKLILAISYPKSPAVKVKAPKPSIKKLSKSTKKTHSKKLQFAFSSLLLIGGLCGALFFGMQTIASPIESVPIPTKSQKPVTAPKTKQFLPNSKPVTLRIPAIELDTQLTTIGLAPDGTIEVPPDYTRAGWYHSSPTPGEAGPAIIVGHLDNIKGQAVFWRLKELTPGQMIEVVREDGSTAKFIVEKLKQVPQDDSFPTEEVYGNTDKAALRLITCSGTFNHLTQRYSDNTVVFASLVL